MTRGGVYNSPLKSVYEVGCGSGANLYLFERDGIECGGIDFSANLIRGAQTILVSDDLTCDEAVELSGLPCYDGVFANSVFSYFLDLDYARAVLEKMVIKSRFSIGIIDIHDVDKKEDYTTYRKSQIKDYEERYKDFPKLFYPKEFFINFAKEHDLDIEFSDFAMDNYWNNDFVFHCYMYKKDIEKEV